MESGKDRWGVLGKQEEEICKGPGAEQCESRLRISRRPAWQQFRAQGREAVDEIRVQGRGGLKSLRDS